MDLVTLVCPPGSSDYPISHGLVDYRKDAYRSDHLNPDADWLVPVPRDVAQHFLHRGGFRLASMEKIDPALSGETVRLVDKDGDVTRTCGVAGVEYTPDADGELVVASEHAAELEASHGFVRAAEKPPTKAEARADAVASDTKALDMPAAKELETDAATKPKTSVRRPAEAAEAAAKAKTNDQRSIE